MSDSIIDLFRCSEDGCDRKIWTFTRRCLIHEIAFQAKWMGAQDLAFIRDVLSQVVPTTAAERRERRVQSALNGLAEAAKRHRMAHHSALLAGAEIEQALSTTDAAYEHIDELEARAAEAKRSTT